ncbi:hypothetical protein SO802_031723 [Lithocarpus litseifolius]|uniref:RRM domain-containing protein n=1 Tax=Lithocarpus litseifolius TaxID=425828 RepID=A0AAW2BLV1_9ROSI
MTQIETQMMMMQQQLGFEAIASKPSDSESMIALLIHHLPEAIPHDTLSRLFSHYGASSVRPCSSPRLRFLGKVLSVERASSNKPNLDNKLQSSEARDDYDFVPPSSLVKDATSPKIRLNVQYLLLNPLPQGLVSTIHSLLTLIDKDVAHEAIGVKHATLVPKEIPTIKKKNPVFFDILFLVVLLIKIALKVIQNEHRDESTAEELEEPDKEGSDIKSYATPEELESGKLPPEEILSLPMFKNYAAGNPASVLYIKNLAKDMIADDFYFIFGSLFGSIDAAKSGLSVKLMQEGRMRGQAFVTFPSAEVAHRALNLVNGYVFKGKPMIIQFGRNPAATKAN